MTTASPWRSFTGQNARMSEWGVALIAAGSAVAGSIATGWYTRNAGLRQAEAAKHAGNRQADALLDTVRANLDEQRRSRIEDRRRQAYVAFLEAAQKVVLMDRDTPAGLADLTSAAALVTLEGPTAVEAAANDVLSAVNAYRSQDEGSRNADAFLAARQSYLRAVRAALDGLV